MYKDLAVIRHDGEWFLGEFLPLAGDLAKLNDHPPDHFFTHLEPITIKDENEVERTIYKIIWLVKAASNDSADIARAAALYISEITKLNTTRKVFG